MKEATLMKVRQTTKVTDQEAKLKSNTLDTQEPFKKLSTK